MKMNRYFWNENVQKKMIAQGYAGILKDENTEKAQKNYHTDM